MKHKNNIKQQWANIIAISALTIISVALGIMLIWALDNQPILVINNSPFPTRTIREHPTGGGVVFLDVDYCKYRDIQGAMRISFVGEGRETFLPVSYEMINIGCHRLEIPIGIPVGTVAGNYKIKFLVSYEKNPLKQNEVVEFESQNIIID